MSRLYIDTNLFINVINNEVSMHSNKNMAEPWTVKELLKKLRGDQIKASFEILKRKIEICKYSLEEEVQARKRSETNFPDALHIVIAENVKADYIITRNIDDFLQIGTKIPIKKPELL
ncbi:hypothetical protein HYU07_03015 [Candidatus Woesearchaeota archaeon]|nr:hypothetical protein [Candidatus Woesearchaeota archaeon]